MEKIFVTTDDFFNYFGKDLRAMLRSDDNESNQAERFIFMVTDHLMEWIDANTFRRLRYDCLSPYQYKQFQKAILYQTYYTYKEGAKALGIVSGVDDEKGVIIPYETIRETEICPATIDCLSNAGLFNLVVKNVPRTIQGFPEYGFYDCEPKPCPKPEPEPQPQPCPTSLPGLAYTEADND